MNTVTLYTACNTPALQVARQNLSDRGITVVDQPSKDVTHLLLSVPSFEPDGSLKGGGDIEHILAALSEDVCVLGGNLSHSALSGRSTFDLLQNEDYLAENAAITASKAITLAATKLPVVWRDLSVAVIGWGRIGKCLAADLAALGAKVTVAARKNADRAMIRALGYSAEDTTRLGPSLTRYRVIFNTAPEMVISEAQRKYCQKECLLMDLASKPGIAGDGVMWERGLPGKYAPESSGLLIAKTVMRYLKEKEGVL